MSDLSALHQALVDKLKSKGCIQTPRVEAAFRAVPRHVFLPGVPLERVYCDEVITLKCFDGVPVSSSSQPAIMATMLEQLDLEPGHRVLEIGAGSGYNAALIAHIVGDGGEVITVDLDEKIMEYARARLADAGFGRVRVVCGDGGLGDPSAAPYDRIILTVGAWDIVPAWVEQLKPVGRLVLPLSIRGVQRSVAFDQANGSLTSVSVADCDFVWLRGAFAGPGARVPLDPERGISIWFDDCCSIDVGTTYALLTGPRRDQSTSIRATACEIFGGLLLWLALREPGLCELFAAGPVADHGIVPYLFGLSGRYCRTTGLLEGTTMCMLMRPPDQSLPLKQADDPHPFELSIRSFGPDDALVRRLMDHIIAWDTAGRPSTKGLRIRAYPIERSDVPSAGEHVIDKRWTRLVLDWQHA